MIKKAHPELSIVLPFYNEQNSIEPLLSQYNRFTKKYDFELVCVNNGSTDETEKIFNDIIHKQKYKFLKIVTVNKNLGYGHGIMSGVRKAKAEVIAWTHADMQTLPDDVFKAYEIFKQANNTKTLVKGRRIGRNPVDAFVSNCMAFLASVILRMRLDEINAQPKLFHKSLLAKLTEHPYDFLLDLYLLFSAKKLNYKITSFNVKFPERLYGKSKWAYSFRSRFRMIRNTIRYIYNLSIGKP